MGCTASKLDNEDTVKRCKDRRRLMKEAVYARHHLATAHSDYCRSLRVTGSALSAFAAGEPLSVSDQTPAVLLRTPSSLSRSTTTPINPHPPSVPSPSLHHPPPHPPAPFPPSPSATIASSKLAHTLSAPNLSSSRHRKPIKLPHILSESSLASSPRSHNPARSNNYAENYTYNANSTYSATPSQASSVWNWENFYPPSPPGSEFFQRRNDEDDKVSEFFQRHNNDDDKASEFLQRHNDDDKASEFFQRSNNDDDKASNYSHYQNHQKHHHIDVDDEAEGTEREEVQCSEWGDHYSTTSSSENEDGDKDSRSEIGTRSNFGSSVHNDSKAQPASKYSTMSKSDKSEDVGSSVSWNAGNSEIPDMKIVVRHRDLAEIVAAIKEYFEKEAAAGEAVSEMLETGRAQLDRSFRQLKKTVYHSSGVFSNLSSSWTSKPPLAVKYRFEPGSMDESGGPKSLCSTLERLLAWEKKLYQEVKGTKNRQNDQLGLTRVLAQLHRNILTTT